MLLHQRPAGFEPGSALAWLHGLGQVRSQSFSEPYFVTCNLGMNIMYFAKFWHGRRGAGGVVVVVK